MDAPKSEGRPELGQAVADRAADELLAVRCQLGEPTAFDDLIERWHLPIWRYARRVTGDSEAASEVVQETWLRVLRAIGRLRDPASLRAWLFGIAHRVAIDRLRARYRSPEFGDLEPERAVAAEPDDALERELATMEHELARLPVQEREILTLFYLRELSLADVATALSIPVGTVKSRLFRARRLLRRELLKDTD